jgi:hypothetical protein
MQEVAMRRTTTLARVNKPSISFLVQETADGLVTLVAAHLRVANLELGADLDARATRLALEVGVTGVAVLGYLLLIAGVALVAGRWLGQPLALVILGAVHLAAAAIAAAIVGSRRRVAAVQISSPRALEEPHGGC